MIDFKYKAKILKVVDGDTVDCEVDLGFHLKKVERIRLALIDAPELNSGNPVAKEAREFLSRYLGLDIILETKKADKYGRYLGTIFVIGDDESLNKKMLDLDLALPY